MSTSNTCMGVYEFTDPNIKLFTSVIKPIVETHSGLSYIDAMSQYESHTIKMDLILRMISEANLVIVDISKNNPNVFLELGIAYTLKKPIIILCTKQAFSGNKKDSWREKIPFDIRSNEILLFENEKELKVKLGKFISDALYKTKLISVSWCSDNARNHVKSSSELALFDRGNVWSNVGLNPNFTVSYRVKIKNLNSVTNPDLRFFISSSQKGYPRIVVIFPWEFTELEPSQFECHVDYFKIEDPGVDQINHPRLQQVAVATREEKNLEDFDVFISFCWPNLVFESSLFEDRVKRLVVPISKFRDLGFPIHLAQFVGFEAINGSHVEIDQMVIKEILL